MVKLIKSKVQVPKQKIKKTIITFFLLLSFIVLNPNIVGNANTSVAKGYPIQKIEPFRPLSKDSINYIYSSLILEIDNYIISYAPNSKLLSLTFVRICKKNNFDIVLAMSQAHIESHYGTKGVASRTNSVFNVGTYDDGTIKYRYSDPNHSIEPYTSLMNRNYLRNNKTADDILKPWSFVDFKGDRYASFKYYEHRVKKVYDDIKKNTKIDKLYKIYTSDHYNESIILHNNYDDFIEFIRNKNRINNLCEQDL